MSDLEFYGILNFSTNVEKCGLALTFVKFELYRPKTAHKHNTSITDLSYRIRTKLIESFKFC